MRRLTCAQTAPNQPESPKPRQLVKWHKGKITTTAREFKTIQRFVDKCLEHVPSNIKGRLITRYCEQYASTTARNPERAANIHLRKSTKPIQRIARLLPFNDKRALYRDDALESEARFAQAYCRQQLLDLSDLDISYQQKLIMAQDACFEFAKRFDIEKMFSAKNPTTEILESSVVRYDCEKWWLRKLKKVRAQAVEYMSICAGYVGKKKQEYVSNQCVSDYRQQRRANRHYLESMDVVNEETDERMSLADIADATTANPELRRTELMVRCRGLENLADDLDYSAFFVTWTAPSKYHQSSRKWNNAKPTTTQKYLTGQWAKCRAKIKREKVKWFGVRVAEPHADSTPHWHILVFVEKGKANLMQSIMRGYALEHDENEKGAQKYRFDCEEIDKSKGSATGYIAKYISKNINAARVANEPDFDGSGSLSDAVDRVTAWSSLWRIRQFQFFGVQPVTIYREARRVTANLGLSGFDQVRTAADSGKWDSFTKSMLTNHVELAYGMARNCYGESVKVISGLICDGVEILTREVKYRIEKRRAQQAKSGDSRAPWSTVNNCTVLADKLKPLLKIAQIAPQFAFSLASGQKIHDRGREFKLINNQLCEVT